MQKRKLVRWIKRHLKKGYSAGELKNVLLSQNWHEKEIDDAMMKVSGKERRPERDKGRGEKTGKKKALWAISIFFILAIGVSVFFLRADIVSFGQSIMHSNLEDCGSSIHCLALDSINCTPSEAVISSSTTVLGVTKSKTTRYEITGPENGKCAFYLKVEKDSLSFSSGVSQSTIDSQKKSYVSQERKSGTCLFNEQDLSNMLAKWEHGEFSSTDFSSAQCSGSYFNS